MSRRRNAIFGIVFGYASIAIALTRNVLLVPIYLHSIPLNEYGAWLATGGALALMLISDFGLSGVVTQKISASFGAGDLGSISSLTGSAFVIGLLLALLLTAISLLFVPFLPGLQTLSDLQKHAVVDCFLIAIAANAVGLIGATALSVIRSLQMAVLAGSIALLADLANIFVTVVALFSGKGLYAIAAGVLTRSAILSIAAPIGVWFICARVLSVTVTVHWPAVRNLMGDSSRFFLSALAMKIQAQANVFFVSSILGPTNAGIYSLTVRAHETVLMLISQINAALVPSVTHLFGSGNLERFRAVLLRVMLTIAGVTAFALSLTIILDAGFLRLWVGAYGFGGQDLSILMGVALFVSSVGYVAYDALVAQGKFQLISLTFMLTSTFQVVLLMSLLGRGIWIAPAATLIAACFWGVFFWKTVGISIGVTPVERRGLLSELGRIVGFSILAVAAFMTLYPETASWFGLVVEGSLGTAVLGGGYLLLSSQIRSIVREEYGATVRALKAA